MSTIAIVMMLIALIVIWTIALVIPIRSLAYCIIMRVRQKSVRQYFGI